MKINQRIYSLANEELMIEKQEINDNVVEIYKLNDYEDIFEEFTNKAKFAVWSSEDGKNYRLFIEEGYYEKIKPLYQSKVNKVWLGFWDACEEKSKKYRKIIMPTLFVVIALMLLLSNILPQQAGLISTLVIAIIFTVFMLSIRKITNRDIAIINSDSIKEIKKILGEKKFNDLLKYQREYIDEFFGFEDEIEEEIIEEQTEEIIEEETQEVENKEV